MHAVWQGLQPDVAPDAHQRIHTAGRRPRCPACGQAPGTARRWCGISASTRPKAFRCAECGPSLQPTAPASASTARSTRAAGPMRARAATQLLPQLAPHPAARARTGEKPLRLPRSVGPPSPARSSSLFRTGACTPAKPFACPQCGRAFSHSSNLRQHRLLHTGDGPSAARTAARPSPRARCCSATAHPHGRPAVCAHCDAPLPRRRPLPPQRLHTGEKSARRPGPAPPPARPPSGASPRCAGGGKRSPATSGPATILRTTEA